MYAVSQSISLDLILSIFSNKIPLWIAKRCFEFFLWRSDGEECLFDLLANLLKKMKFKMLTMNDSELYRYLMDKQFVIDGFDEAKGTDDWIQIFSSRRDWI